MYRYLLLRPQATYLGKSQPQGPRVSLGAVCPAPPPAPGPPCSVPLRRVEILAPASVRRAIH